MIFVFVPTKSFTISTIPAVIVLRQLDVDAVLARNTSSERRRRPVLMERGRVIEEPRMEFMLGLDWGPEVWGECK
jgi:hypothetical protein